MGHDHHHDHDHDPGSDLSETQIRVRALESVLVEKGYVDPAALDELVETYETRVGPHNGARVVATGGAAPPRGGGGARRRGPLPPPRGCLWGDGGAAIGSLGYTGRQGENLLAV